MKKRIDMSGMKRMALGLPAGPLRDDILQQPDEVDAEEYLANARVWLRMARAS
jgi:hypothetical protein